MRNMEFQFFLTSKWTFLYILLEASLFVLLIQLKKHSYSLLLDCVLILLFDELCKQNLLFPSLPQ